MAFVLDVNLVIRKISGLGQLEAKLAAVGRSASAGLSQGFRGLNKQLAVTDALATKTASSLGKSAKAQADFSKTSKDAGKSLNGLNKNLKDGTKNVKGFGDGVLLAGSRYAKFVAATAVPLAIVASLAAATSAAIEFEQQLLKLDQVLSPTTARFQEIRSVILQLSTETGVAAGEIAEAARILAQAGALTADVDLRSALSDLAKVPLLPTFEGIEQATEGILAFTKQFGLEISDTGAILEKLNAVSKQFAVESSDLIEAARRGGAAFSAFGGDIDEFIAIVATLRQTTRESASSIGTALKTISTRVIREDNIALLERFNVQVRDSNGELLNSIDILRNLGQGFNDLGKAQQRELAEQLGGFRQVGKVVAALGDGFETFDRAVKVSRDSLNTLGTDAAKALDTVGGQFNLLKAELNAFVQALSPGLILPIVGGLVKIASVVTDIARLFAPAIELATEFGLALATIAAFRFSPALFKLLKVVGGKLGGVLVGGGAAAAAAGAGAAVAGGAAALGPVAQIAIFAGLNAVVGETIDILGLSNTAIGESINTFTFLSTSVIALVAVLSKQTLLATAFSGPGAIIAAAVATGLVIGEGAAQAANTVANAITTASDNFADRVGAIDFKDTEDAIGGLAFVINTSLAEIGAAAEKEFSGITGGVANVRIRLAKAFDEFTQGNIIKGLEDLFSNTTLGLDEAKRILNQGIGGSAELFATVIKQAFDESGTAFVKDLANKLSGGDTRKAAVFTEVINDLIGQFGGIEKILSGSVGQLVDFKKQIENLKKTLPAELFSVSLLSNVNSFTAALGKATEVINRSNQRFEQAIDQDPLRLQPSRRADITPEEVERLLREGGLESLGIEIPELLKGLNPELQTTLKSFQGLKDFAEQLQASLGKIDSEGGEGLDLQKFIANFSESLDIDPKRLTPAFRLVGNAIVEAAKLGAEIDKNLLTKAFDKAFKLDPLIPTVNKAIANLINASQRFAENQLKAQLKFTEIDLKFTETADLPGLINTLFDGAGIEFEKQFGVLTGGFRRIISDGFGFDQTAFGNILDANKAGLQELVKVADIAEAAVTLALEDFQKESFASADAIKKLDEALLSGTGNFKKLSDAANAADLEINKTRAAIQALELGLEKSKQAIKNRIAEEIKLAGDNGEKIKQIRRDEAEQIAEIDSQINKLKGTAERIQILTAQRVAGEDPIKQAADIFQTSVTEFATAVALLSKAATVTPEGGPRATLLTETEKQGALTGGAFGIGGGFGELRDLLRQQAESTKLLTLDNLGALLTGGLEQVSQNVTDAAIKGLAERQQGVLAQQGIDVDVITLANQIRLAVTNGFNAVKFQEILETSLTGGQTGRVEALLEALSERAIPEAAETQALEQQIQIGKELATQVGSSIDKITTVLTDFFGGEDRDRSGTEISTEELENALDITKTKTEENTQAIEKATTDQGLQSETLSTSLGEATTAMVDLKEGVDVQLEATQNLSVVVSLDESLTKFKPQLESLMGQVADDHIRQALEGLASNSTDQDRQKEVNDTLEGLA